tara:strand:- start:708 stop:860 length:153 start_codon:yes stop_codon:yes gene_type:complete
MKYKKGDIVEVKFSPNQRGVVLEITEEGYFVYFFSGEQLWFQEAHLIKIY